MFGKTLYQTLKDDLRDYSDVEKFDAEATYNNGDTVIYKNIAYELIVATNEFNNTPNCSNEWALAPKFTTECYNETWTEGGLGKLIAWVVFVKAAGYYPEFLNAAGFSGTDEKYKEKTNNYKNLMYSDIAIMHRQFLSWNKDNGCLDLEDGCDTNLEITKNKVNRKVLMR